MPKRKRAKPPKTKVVTTRAEAAKLIRARLGKGSVRTLADWLKLGCPGKPGHYDVDAIEAWARDNIDVEKPANEEEDRAYWSMVKIREQALLAELTRKEREGQLVDVGETTRLIERLAAEVTALLDQLPDWFLTLLPAKTPAKEKKATRERVERKIDDVRHAVGNALQEWAER